MCVLACVSLSDSSSCTLKTHICTHPAARASCLVIIIKHRFHFFSTKPKSTSSSSPPHTHTPPHDDEVSVCVGAFRASQPDTRFLFQVVMWQVAVFLLACCDGSAERERRGRISSLRALEKGERETVCGGGSVLKEGCEIRVGLMRSVSNPLHFPIDSSSCEQGKGLTQAS